MENKYLYRVTVFGTGYFNYLKSRLSKEDWLEFKQQTAWLIAPKIDMTDSLSMFTEEGYKRFLKDTVYIYPLPIHVDRINIDTVDMTQARYKDYYQIVW